jgi:hypothetical protein
MVEGEVYALFQEDQGDREDVSSHWHDKEWNQRLKARDRERRRRLEELRAAGALQTGPDYYHAAMLYQHGDGPDDFWQAHEWSMQAVTLGCEEARWLAAASYDRWLTRQGKPQKYGTNFLPVYLPTGAQWALWDVDPRTTDEERAQWNVPTLAQQQQRAEEMTKHAPPSVPQLIVYGEAPPWRRKWHARKVAELLAGQEPRP